MWIVWQSNAVKGRGFGSPNLQSLKLSIETWNVTSLVGKEPKLVQEVDRYQLDIVGLPSKHNSDSGTSLLERGWIFLYA